MVGECPLTRLIHVLIRLIEAILCKNLHNFCVFKFHGGLFARFFGGWDAVRFANRFNWAERPIVFLVWESIMKYSLND